VLSRQYIITSDGIGECQFSLSKGLHFFEEVASCRRSMMRTAIVLLERSAFGWTAQRVWLVLEGRRWLCQECGVQFRERLWCKLCRACDPHPEMIKRASGGENSRPNLWSSSGSAR
jgi:hypothetical protein